jgi:hypothetical protein
MRRSSALGLAVALILAGSAALTGAAQPQELRATYLGSFTWSLNAPWFGGFSGLELSADGKDMMVLSDKGNLLDARISRDGGRITAIQAGKIRPLKSSTGARLTGRISDSEGLAIAPDGTIYVSFEGVHRVARYGSPSSPAIVLNRPRAFHDLPLNGSLEPLAIDSRGRLYTLPERGADKNGRIPVYSWNGNRWSQPFLLASRGDFLPVGADFGPDGRFYLLERAFGIFGFRTRIRRWDLTETQALNEQTLLQTSAGTHDNLEGIAIWRGATGRLRATMVSDDNFMFFQKTELVDYALPD